jgi:small subunit ribosomal protein S17
MPGQKRMLTGTVVSDKMENTVVVLVETTTRHRLYRKILKRSKRYMAHDDRLIAKTGDLVRIAETRPLSRHKRWRVVEIVQRRDVADIAPREIDAEYLTMTRERQQPETPPAPTDAPAGIGAGEAPPADETPAADAAEAPEAVVESETPPAHETPAADAPEAPEAVVESETPPASDAPAEAASQSDGEERDQP